jgi:Uma2 family endonuclease
MSTVESEIITQVTPEMAGLRMSPEEFDAIQDWDDNFNYELVHGVLVVVPPPSEGEVGPNEVLGHSLLSYQEHHPQGSALDLTLPENLIKTPDSRRRADRVIWTGIGKLPKVRRDRPTIAVEFVSAGKRNVQRDYLDKRGEYMRVGLQEYWIIDRFRRQMTVVKRKGKKFVDQVIRESEIYTTPLLPGFELPLGKLLAVADALDEAASDDDNDAD